MAPLQAGARGPIAPAIAPNTLRFGGASRALPCFSPSGEPLSPSASSPLKSLGGNPVRVRNPGPGTEASRDPSAVSGLVRPAICTTTGTKSDGACRLRLGHVRLPSARPPRICRLSSERSGRASDVGRSAPLRMSSSADRSAVSGSLAACPTTRRSIGASDHTREHRRPTHP